MHTFAGKSCTFNYNSDMSTVIINKGNESIEIDGDDLFKLAAEYIRLQKITRIESLNWKEILLEII